MAAYKCHKEVSVDESMVKFKGRLFFKQYLPSKPSSKWGIKVWSLCDSRTGFLLKFQAYTGKETAGKETGLGHRVVKELVTGLDKGHVIYMDNFYSSLQLYDDLRLSQLGACGTIRTNRKGLPSEMKSVKLKRGELPVVWMNMICCTWQDTGKVNMISTVGNAGVTDVEVKSKRGVRHVKKPNIQVMYNSWMGGVDRFDQLCVTYPFDRKCKKWYQTLWHFCIEVVLVNAYICYKTQNPTKIMSPRKFREQVIDGLLTGYNRKSKTKRGRRSSDPTQARLVEHHFPRNNNLKKKSPPKCVVYSILPSKCSKEGKGKCRHKQTSFYYGQCVDNPPLCLDPCFEEYHTLVKYKKYCKCGEQE